MSWGGGYREERKEENRIKRGKEGCRGSEEGFECAGRGRGEEREEENEMKRGKM